MLPNLDIHEIENRGHKKYELANRKPNGEACEVQRKKDGRKFWEAYRYASDGTKKWGTGKTQKAAVARALANVAKHEARMAAKRLRTDTRPNDFADLSLAEFSRRMIGLRDLGPRSKTKYSRFVAIMEDHRFAVSIGGGQVAPVGEVAIRHISYGELLEFQRNLSRPDESGESLYSPGYRSDLREFLMGVGRKAVNFGVRSDNPARELPVIRVAEKPPVELTIEQIRLLFEAAADWRLKAWVVLAAHGLRFAEIQGLTWDVVRGNLLVVSRQWKRIELPGDEVVLGLGPRKSDGAVYKVSLSDAEMAVLLNSVEHAKLVRVFVVGEGWQDLLPVVPGDDGGVFKEKTLRRRLRRLFDACGLTTLVPHEFRAQHVTEALSSDENIKFVSRSVGHSDVQTTRRYERPQHGPELDVHARRSKRLALFSDPAA